MTIASNIVVEWLRSLHLGQYSESFIDNGYDELEICKQIGDPDLDAIGVFNQNHRSILLQSVKALREEGAASVYFTLEESTDCLCDNTSSKSSRTSSERPPSDKEVQRVSPTASSSSGGPEFTKFNDEYEEGKAELIRIPRFQLKMLLQEKLRQDGIALASQPFTTPDGDQGYLEGLASRYADLFKTHYADVLEPLEEIRRRDASHVSLQIPSTQLTTSHSQPIYVPGKYLPSSCLSDKEEDEIYGFGYGIFGRQMLHQRQQKFTSATNHPLIAPGGHPQSYQSCLSPRSAFFYEFPPSEQGQNISKKKTTFSKLLRGLKAHRKEKQSHNHGSPKHSRSTRIGVPQRVDTPDNVLQSGLGLGPDMGYTILRSMVDPRDYERLRYLQMNGSQPTSFEETIHRLKVQDALKKKERFDKEHEEILRDIRQGLLQLGRNSRGQLTGDDTYMYDEDARCGTGVSGSGVQHWYDEPPYESDPEEFLIDTGSGPVPTATIQNGRVCFTLNLRPENRGEGIISLRTAGDISLPRDRSRKATSTIRGLIVPNINNPPTIIPLTHSRASRESGDYASSDIQSRSSGDQERVSPGQSSDYEDQEELENQHSTAGLTSEASALIESGIAGRARNLRQDVQRKITRLKQDRSSSEVFPCSTSSVESLPSGSGSSTQALVRADSNHSSISCEERDVMSPTSIGPVLCRARAIVDYNPSPYDKEALKFKKGDNIDVIQMNPSGLWKGMLHNRVGYFKFINVEILVERVSRRSESEKGKWGQKYRQKPSSVHELLQRMNLQEHIPVFVLNGYEDLELFREIEPADLDYLRIHQPEHRAKILTAVQLLHDLQSGSEGDLASSSEGDEIHRLTSTSGQTPDHCSPFSRRQFPRDSGCYDAHKNPRRRIKSPDEQTNLSRENNLDSSIGVNKCQSGGVSEIKNKDDYHPNIPNIGVGLKIGKEIGTIFQPLEGQQFEKAPQLRNTSNSVRFLAKKGMFNETIVIEDEINNQYSTKQAIPRYGIVGNNDLTQNCEGVNTNIGRSCLSEKSSDSGISSSSISSAPPPCKDLSITKNKNYNDDRESNIDNEKHRDIDKEKNNDRENNTDKIRDRDKLGLDSNTKNFINTSQTSPTSPNPISKS